MLVKLEVPELIEILSLMRYSSNNINQIAHRLNESGRIYEADIADVQDKHEKLWAMLNNLLEKLNAIG